MQSVSNIHHQIQTSNLLGIVLHFDPLCLVQRRLPSRLLLQILHSLRLADGRQRPRRLLLRLQPRERALRVQPRLLFLLVGSVGSREVELGEDHFALLVEHLALLRVALAPLPLLVLGQLLEVELSRLKWTREKFYYIYTTSAESET